MADIRLLAQASRPERLTRFLFSLRRLLGWLFRWDQEPGNKEGMFESRLTEADRSRSAIPSGTKDGPFTLLYLHSTEAISEIRNSTVHAALVWVLIPRKKGYRLIWAIYVKPVGRLTALYMRLIGPFRRWIVYPSLLGSLHRAWCRAYPSC